MPASVANARSAPAVLTPFGDHFHLRQDRGQRAALAKLNSHMTIAA